jgi:hypothetical protein
MGSPISQEYYYREQRRGDTYIDALIEIKQLVGVSNDPALYRRVSDIISEAIHKAHK